MTDTVFSGFPTVTYEGESSNNPMAYRFYNPEQVIMGKPMAEHLRFAVAYWHSLAMNGSDPFGAPTILRPWMNGSDPMAAARAKADAAFDLFHVLDVPFFTFHDRDIAPEGDSLRQSLRNVHEMADYLGTKI